MLELLQSHASEIASLIAGAIGGSLLTLRLTREQRATGRANAVDQSKARASGGDIVGRDKTVTTSGPAAGRPKR